MICCHPLICGIDITLMVNDCLIACCDQLLVGYIPVASVVYCGTILGPAVNISVWDLVAVDSLAKVDALVWLAWEFVTEFDVVEAELELGVALELDDVEALDLPATAFSGGVNA